MASSQNELRIVLIGKTGNGKSSTGNSLLHSRTAFHAIQSDRSITKNCQAQRHQYTDNTGQQKTVTIVDTPGFFDTDTTITNEAVERIIASQIFNMTTPGVHAFLIILAVGRFTPEEQKTVQFIRTIFGPDAVKYCIVVFTREDQLEEGQTLQEFIRNAKPELRELIQACNNRTIGINNKLNGEKLEKKTKDLIQMIETMVRNNNGTYYTNEKYQQIERQRREEQRKREEEEQKKKKAQEDALIARTREEERKKAEQRERELKNDLDSARRSQRRSNDDDNGISIIRALHSLGLGNSMSGMNSGMCMPCSPMSGGMGMPCSPMGGGMGMPYSPMSGGMEMPVQRMGSARSGMGSAHGGRFTGEFMATHGAANGRPIYEGPRGGQYHMTESGRRSYIRK